jgi:hypothetical protein
MPSDVRLPSILRGLDEREEIYYVLASVVGLQSMALEALPDDETSAIVRRLLAIIEADDGVIAARTSVSVLGFLRRGDAIEVSRFVQHPNKVVAHNAMAWLIGALSSEGIGELTAIAEASGIPRETAEHAVDQFKAHARNMETEGSSRLAVPLYAYIPNLRDVER